MEGILCYQSDGPYNWGGGLISGSFGIIRQSIVIEITHLSTESWCGHHVKHHEELL